MISVRWTERGYDSLAGIKDVIAKDSPAYAIAVVTRLYNSIGQLAEFPDSGRVVPERNDPTIRELVRPPYRIVYKRRSDVLEILVVFRSSLPLPKTGLGRGAV